MRDSRRAFDELARALIRPERNQTRMTGTSTSGGVDEVSQDDAWVNPMTTEGDLIVGGESGAADRIGIGTPDQVLTSDGTTASWQDSAAVAASTPSLLRTFLLMGA